MSDDVTTVEQISVGVCAIQHVHNIILRLSKQKKKKEQQQPHIGHSAVK